MSKFRNALPQLGDRIFLTDGGLETTLVFLEGIDLPHFAAFTLIGNTDGEKALKAYYESYARIASDAGLGFILDTATWRANTDWGARLGYDAAGLDRINRRAVALIAEVARAYEQPNMPVVLNGVLGPRGDGYVADQAMTADEARAYPLPQVRSFYNAGVDMVSAVTMNYVDEAIGIALAARELGLPAVISFTVETDGRLPTGMELGEAIRQVETATGGSPAYYMINCAHPSHFEHVLSAEADWVKRLRGIRANASKRSHAELDAAPDLDAGDPVELGQQYRAIRTRLSHINVLGGCCGTDCRHIDAIRYACLAA